MADSPGSPLSSHSSSEFTEDVKFEDREASLDIDHSYAGMPPSKRQKTGASSYRSTPQYDAQEDGDISSDTSGSAPNSPVAGAAYVQDDEPSEQVTVCRWRNCPAGDLGNMDNLVDHIKDVHIDHHSGRAQKKFVCEWEGCSRIDIQGTSAYALRSHMRSHTREKPFFCALPECDKAFTRSDALAKHMRTVHETEALRPSDPVPRNHSQAHIKPQKLKLTFKKSHNSENGPAAEEDIVDGEAEVNGKNGFTYPTDVQFTDEEHQMPPDYLYKLCRRQIHWSEQEGERLKQECSTLDAKQKEEWQNKELLLINVIEAELAQATQQNGLLKTEHQDVEKMKADLLPAKMLPLSGEAPWYRKSAEDTFVDAKDVI